MCNNLVLSHIILDIDGINSRSLSKIPNVL